MRQLVVTVFLLSMPVAAFAEVNCSDALVKDTYQITASDQLDWRMASLVTESQYNEAKQGGGLNVVIYGVPVGANYQDFKKNISNSSNSQSASLTHNQFENILWTYVDPSASTNYIACINAQLDSRGLHLAVRHASATSISVSISWTPQNLDPRDISPTWSWHSRVSEPFPLRLTAGRIDVVVPRPSQEQILAVRWKGAGDSIVIEPLAAEPPQRPFTTANTINKSDAEPSGACGSYSSWHSICTDDKPEGWKIVSHNFSLVGDRSCSGWAHCEKTKDEAGKVCYRFNLQGHDEECHWNSSNTGIHDSQGVLSATWLHQ